MLLKKQSQVDGSLELLPSLTSSDPLAIKYHQQYNKSADYSQMVPYTKNTLLILFRTVTLSINPNPDLILIVSVPCYVHID